MDLTSSFTALLSGDEGDTEEMKHTNTQGMKHSEAHTFSLHPRLPPPTLLYTRSPVLQHIHMTLMFVFKIQLPTY